jgi:hypothetical protein
MRFRRLGLRGSEGSPKLLAGVSELSISPVLKHGPRSLTYMQVLQLSRWMAKLMQKAPMAPSGSRNALLTGLSGLDWSLSMSC